MERKDCWSHRHREIPKKRQALHRCQFVSPGLHIQWKDIICVIQKEMKMVVKNRVNHLGTWQLTLSIVSFRVRRFKQRGGEGPRWLVDTFFFNWFPREKESTGVDLFQDDPVWVVVCLWVYLQFWLPRLTMLPCMCRNTAEILREGCFCTYWQSSEFYHSV